jgi:hypothetical protein
MPDPSEPLPRPEFDPLPEIPNPVAFKSRDDIPVMKPPVMPTGDVP